MRAGDARRSEVRRGEAREGDSALPTRPSMRRSREWPARFLLRLVAVWLAALPGSVFARDFDSVEIRTLELGRGLYMLVGSGGNIGVCVGKDGIFLIDDQFAQLTPKIKHALAELSDEPIRFVLNTHWHSDHTGGNEILGGEGALIVAHDNVRRRMSTEQFMEAFGRRVPASPIAALPVVSYDQSVTFHLNGHEIHAFHVDPAHTDGDSIVHFKGAGVVHMGDTYFNGMYPFFDASSGGRFEGLIEATNGVLEWAPPDARIIPGHGALSGRSELVAYRDMLVDVRGRVRRAVEQGQGLEEWVAAAPTADLDERWGGGFMKPAQWSRLVFQSLAPGAGGGR